MNREAVMQQRPVFALVANLVSLFSNPCSDLDCDDGDPTLPNSCGACDPSCIFGDDFETGDSSQWSPA